MPQVRDRSKSSGQVKFVGWGNHDPLAGFGAMDPGQKHVEVIKKRLKTANCKTGAPRNLQRSAK